MAWSVGSFLNGTTMLHIIINAHENTKRRRQSLTELAVVISAAEADLAVHEASTSAAEVELSAAQENPKQRRSELTKLATAISVTEVELAVQAASTSAADDELAADDALAGGGQ